MEIQGGCDLALGLVIHLLLQGGILQEVTCSHTVRENCSTFLPPIQPTVLMFTLRWVPHSLWGLIYRVRALLYAVVNCCFCILLKNTFGFHKGNTRFFSCTLCMKTSAMLAPCVSWSLLQYNIFYYTKCSTIFMWKACSNHLIYSEVYDILLIRTI